MPPLLRLPLPSLLLLLLGTAAVHAQPVDTARIDTTRVDTARGGDGRFDSDAPPVDSDESDFDSPPVDVGGPEPDRIDSLYRDSLGHRTMYEGPPFRFDFGVQMRVSEPLAGRLNVAIGADFFQSSLFSFSVAEGRDQLGTFFSLNPLLSLSAFLGSKLSGYLAFLFLLPQALPNTSLELPVVRRRLSLTVGVRTDYFWKGGVFRIHCEAQGGLRFYTSWLMVEGLCILPLTESVVKKELGFGVGVHFVFSPPLMH